MKFFFALILITLFIFSTSNEIAGQEYTLDYEHITIGDFIDSLEVKAGISVSYDASAFPVDKYISIKVTNFTAKAALEKILEKYPVEISVLDGQVIIHEKKGIDKSYVTINGTIFNTRSMEALDLVNIAVDGKSIGTVSNEDGEFVFKYARNLEGKYLIFSRLGFDHQVIAMPGVDTTLTIALSESSIPISEVKVSNEDVRSILRKTVENLKKNYPNERKELIGFFRETVSRDKEYLNVTEALISIQKGEYQNEYIKERVKFIKGRKKDFGNKGGIEFKVQGGPFLFSRIDPVRNRDFFPVFDHQISFVDDFNKYKYEYFGKTILNGDVVHRIKFYPQNDVDEIYYTGELFIHSESYAVVKTYYGLTKPSLRRSKSAFVMKEKGKIKTVPVTIYFTVDYRQQGDVWMLSKVKGNLKMRVINRTENVNTLYNAQSELLITEMKPMSGSKYKYSETFKEAYILSDEINASDVDFWDEYNIIKPNQTIEDAFRFKKADSKE